MVPEHIAERISGAADPLAESIALATEQVREMREIADGVHIMPLGPTTPSAASSTAPALA